MSKVYVVTRGEYSDYHIEAILTTYESASDLVGDLNEGGDYGTARVEVWDLDKHCPKVYKYEAYLDASGNLEELREGNPQKLYRFTLNGETPFSYQHKDRGRVFVGQGTDPEEAIKNAKDYRAAWLANPANAKAVK